MTWIADENSVEMISMKSVLVKIRVNVASASVAWQMTCLLVESLDELLLLELWKKMRD